MHRRASLVLMLALALGGCAAGDRGVSSPHQPIVSATEAHVSGCPDWRAPRTGATEGLSPNYGCASSTNLAAMVADPADLLHGRAGDATEAELATRAIRAWREVAPTSKLWVVTTAPTQTTGGGGKP